MKYLLLPKLFVSVFIFSKVFIFFHVLTQGGHSVYKQTLYVIKMTWTILIPQR